MPWALPWALPPWALPRGRTRDRTCATGGPGPGPARPESERPQHSGRRDVIPRRDAIESPERVKRGRGAALHSVLAAGSRGRGVRSGRRTRTAAPPAKKRTKIVDSGSRSLAGPPAGPRRSPQVPAPQGAAAYAPRGHELGTVVTSTHYTSNGGEADVIHMSMIIH